MTREPASALLNTCGAAFLSDTCWFSEVATGQKFFAVPMYEHGCQSDAHVCGRPNAVWSVLNARTMHYTEQHGGKKPDSKAGVIWACLRAEQPTSQAIRFVEGPRKPSGTVIRSVLNASASSETESQPRAAAEQAVSPAETDVAPTQKEAEHARLQPEVEHAQAQTQADHAQPQTQADHAHLQTEAEHAQAQVQAETQTEVADLFADWGGKLVLTCSMSEVCYSSLT